MSKPLSTKSPVLIVGAGPTGLLCSIWLTRYGVPHRIIDKLSAPGLASRAMGVHARTLELYRSLGFAQSIIDLGHAFDSYSFFHRGEHILTIPIGRSGVGLSPYPIVLSVTQDEHEEYLEKHLSSLGKTVDRNVELLSLQMPTDKDDSGAIEAILRRSDGKEEQFMASYVIGCDGARSNVRHLTAIAMEGGTYPNSFYVADVVCSGTMATGGRMNLCITRDEYACFLPLPHQEGRARIIGLVPAELEEKQSLSFEDLRPTVEKAAPEIEVGEVQWFATYKVHHRCASQFQLKEKVFLSGDAAHLHSPVGAQGMNTGLGDVSNLAWKLATAWHSKDSAILDVKALLASYEAERRPFAYSLVATTDTFFKYFTSKGIRGYIMRNFLLYYIAPILNRILNVGRIMYKLESQIAIAYPDSEISMSIGEKSLLPGARLPWVSNVKFVSESKQQTNELVYDADNHAVLNASSWQVHVYSDAFNDDSRLAQKRLRLEKAAEAAGRRQATFHLFLWNEEARVVGYKQDDIYIVRPDGYIGLVIGADIEGVETVVDEYLQRWGAQWLPKVVS